MYATPATTFTGGTYASTSQPITLTSVIVGAGASSISTYFGVPILPRGSYNITITPPAGDTQNIPYPSFVITPQITLGTTSGHIGDRLTISGNGFAANNTITIYFDGIPQTPVSAITTDAYGEFANAAIIVPSMQGGSHTVTALDSIGSSPGVAYSISSSMTLSATTGTVGSTIAVSVTGFAANTTPSFLIDGTAVTVSVRTDAYGSLSNVSVVIPPLSAGSHTLTVQDTAGHLLSSSFSVTSTMTINPTSGPVDTSVTVTGAGFQASRPIAITYDGVPITASSSPTTIGSNGSFTIGFKVPAGASGVHVIKASDGVNSGSANFTSSLTASVNVTDEPNVTSGPVGTSVTANGTGFKSNASITIIYNGIQKGTAITDAKGNLATTFKINAAPTGSHVLVITDGTNTQSFSFTVTPTATIDSTKGTIGSSINVSGSGFNATQGITVKYDNAQIATSSTDENGTFTVTFKAPVSKGGAHTITVSDGTNTKTFDYVIDATPPPTPVLSLPANMTRGDKIPTLSWQDVTDANGGIVYTLQLSKDIGFNSILLEKDGLTTSTYTFAQIGSITIGE